ncbi:MAG: hypothetical protein HQM06_17540 [Magnetococcales bacterium]|nr:hypothetical protein [Magnetococcales bacterium]
MRNINVNNSLGYTDTSLVIALSGFIAGALLGMVMGLWSFDGPLSPPTFLGGYADTPRRLLRLGHIACFGTGILNLLLSRELPRLGLSPNRVRLAALAMNSANISLPLTLVLASLYAPLKYALPVSVFSAFLALLIAAVGSAALIRKQEV